MTIWNRKTMGEPWHEAQSMPPCRSMKAMRPLVMSHSGSHNSAANASDTVKAPRQRRQTATVTLQSSNRLPAKTAMPVVYSRVICECRMKVSGSDIVSAAAVRTH